MSAAAAPAAVAGRAPPAERVGWAERARAAWPLAALLLLAAFVRLATLDQQSLWYDEAFTPVRVLHASLGGTLHGVVRTENSPPAWYVLIWAWTRVFGTGAIALRTPSALAGIATVAVAWGIGRELGRRRTAIVLGAIVALDPLFVWYSQEARVYALFALTAALSMWLFLRALQQPSPRRLGWWAAASGLALATHYFSVFLVGPEAALLLAALLPRWRARLDAPQPPRTALLVAVGAVAAVGVALIPLIAAQGGHGTQWIGAWALSSRLQQIPGYYLLGAQGSVLGHGLLVLCALVTLLPLILVPGLDAGERRSAALVAGLGAVAIAIPLAFALVGADYLAPRNLIAAWIPLSAALAVVLASRRAGLAGTLLAAAISAMFAAVLVDIALSPRLERGDWRGVARVLRSGPADRAIVTVQLGSAPLQYYLPQIGLRPLLPGRSAAVREVDVTGYRPLRHGASRPPTPAFVLAGRRSIHGLLVYRFVAPTPQVLSERRLRSRSITATRSDTLVPGGVTVAG